MTKRPTKRADRAQQPTTERRHASETASTRRSRAQLVAEVEKGLCEIAGVTTRPLAHFLVDQVAKLQPLAGPGRRSVHGGHEPAGRDCPKDRD